MIFWYTSLSLYYRIDYVEARFHVNEMCMAANIPLLESGTEGYVGQVTVIKKVRQRSNNGLSV